MLDVNVLALVRVTQAFLPMLLEQRRSRVINVSSIAGKKASFGQAAYNASKHAQIGITRCLALETGTTGLRVNAVCPGFTPTDLLDLDQIGGVHGKPGTEVLEGAARAASIGRLVTAEEIAEAVAFLTGSGADGINGQSVVVDGGLHMS
jgi:NAD(P)-dependent dehydrogenase (short-subunit alcohol dehydrogenase family)